MTMMTRADIRTELGWTENMIHSLLQFPDLPNARGLQNTGGYTYGLYDRERVLAVAQSTEGRAAQRRWDETLHGDTPNPGWTTRLGDIGRAGHPSGRCRDLGRMSAVRIFELRVTLHPLYNFGRPFEVSLLPSRMRLKVSGQIYEVGDYFDADLQ
jgi:hypothetical protein